ncbi:NAD-dependent succinate-semialdehyde dehydrogenase [Nocardioides sp. Soil777]|uniref:NAD-dependent succinate-semialdehyde dehydrogenase n=1 Tax=Nocardioides sp. Soil777 TaxID=1736409 RepID=UPI000703B3AE|nr:NAD-dependent succinate-semialdehyde dehydrogenase [Nocardioides sp. Soil777]KRE98029.1 NAD-dependent succinate-semialdehyde dehydrogenase [Nocardioides sp. Soil777]
MLFINGSWMPAQSGHTFSSTDPATGEVLGVVADAGRADAVRALEAAQAAFGEWSRKTGHERSAVLYRAWELMLERQEELAKLMSREQGKPLRMARTEVRYAADFLLWFAEEAKRVYGETIPSARADQRFLVMRQPVGVASAITPWNYPISMLTRKIAPALAAGCTIVVKPAEQTPLCAIETIRVLDDAGVPSGVVNLVPSSDPVEVGDELVTNEVVRKVSFTGSTEVGRIIASRAAHGMKRVSMELGGHAPFIVFDDADPVRAAKGAAALKSLNSGQACICENRVFVHRSIAREFTEVLVERMGRMKSGHGLSDGVSIGPLIDLAAIDKMQRHVDDAVAKGAICAVGGKRLKGEEYDDGYFWAPTVLTGVGPDMLIYREETFGPIVPVIEFDDADDVVAMANDTTYGLAAYVYTQNLGRALRTAEALDFGMIGINDINPTSAAVPFGGVKQSGLGREGAREGLLEYLDTKVCGISMEAV